MKMHNRSADRDRGSILVRAEAFLGRHGAREHDAQSGETGMPPPERAAHAAACCTVTGTPRLNVWNTTQ